MISLFFFHELTGLAFLSLCFNQNNFNENDGRRYEGSMAGFISKNGWEGGI